MNNVICPLIAIAASAGRFSSAGCMGDHCAWWDELERGCCLCAIASSLLQLCDLTDFNVKSRLDGGPEKCGGEN